MSKHADDALDIAFGVGMARYVPKDMCWQLPREKHRKWQGIPDGLWQIQQHCRMGEHCCAFDP